MRFVDFDKIKPASIRSPIPRQSHPLRPRLAHGHHGQEMDRPVEGSPSWSGNTMRPWPPPILQNPEPAPRCSSHWDCLRPERISRRGSRLQASPGAFLSRRRGIPGFSFSWRRALGVSQAQARLSRKIGIPLSRSGRQRKLGRSVGCCWVLLAVSVAGVLARLLGK